VTQEAGMGGAYSMHMKITNAHRSLVVSAKPEIKGSHERFSLIRQDNIKTDPTKRM
jgi:hypothetical protein